MRARRIPFGKLFIAVFLGWLLQAALFHGVTTGKARTWSPARSNVQRLGSSAGDACGIVGVAHSRGNGAQIAKRERYYRTQIWELRGGATSEATKNGTGSGMGGGGDTFEAISRDSPFLSQSARSVTAKSVLTASEVNIDGTFALLG